MTNHDHLRLCCRAIENHLAPALGRGWTVSLECFVDQTDAPASLVTYAALTHYATGQRLRIGPYQSLAEAVERARMTTT